MHTRILLALGLVLQAYVATADIIVPGADGSDGIFQPQASITIDLSQAATAAWDSPSPVAGKGVYDTEKWAVVFKYQRVNIPAGVTVTFTNHPSGAPVVWLVKESTFIDGAISLDGMKGHDEGSPRTLPIGAPGGFRGGYGSVPNVVGSGGFGPGAGSPGDYEIVHGAYGTDVEETPVSRIYGNSRIVPLIGGSGGAGNTGYSAGGGSGGGALLIATQKNLTINGLISADGGPGGYAWGGGGNGSPGAIRLLADTIGGNGALRALSSSLGRIRLEANSITLATPGEPLFTAGYPGETAQLWPEDGAPKVRMVSLGGVPVPAEPRANLTDFAQADVPVATADVAQLVIETTNVDTEAAVSVRVTPLSGTNEDFPALYVSTDGNEVSTWHADLPLSQGFSALQVRVVTP